MDRGDEAMSQSFCSRDMTAEQNPFQRLAAADKTMEFLHPSCARQRADPDFGTIVLPAAASSYNGESGGKRGSRFSMKAFMPSCHSGPSISMASASRPMFRAVVKSVSPHSRTAIFD